MTINATTTVAEIIQNPRQNHTGRLTDVEGSEYFIGAPRRDGGKRQVRRHAAHQRVRGQQRRGRPKIRLVAYDPVSRKLAAVAPMDPALVEAFARFEGLTLTELQERFDAAQARFRAWVEDPVNAGRPIAEAPDYLDRIALDSLLERRTWAE